MKTYKFFVICYILLISGSILTGYQIYVPNSPKLAWFNQSTNQYDGLIIDFLNHYQFMGENFTIQVYSANPSVNACTNLLSNQNQDLCLIQYHGETVHNLLTKNPIPIITKSLIKLKPVLVSKCMNNNCSLQPDSALINAIYFLNVFHSSVWSLLLLYILTAGSLLFVFEFTHPFKLGFHKSLGQCVDSLNLLDCLLYVCLGMFLKSYGKSPKSWAGIVLSIFWHAFCLICIIAYVMGTSISIFQHFPENSGFEYEYFQNQTSDTILCNYNEIICEQFKQNLNVNLKWDPMSDADLLVNLNNNNNTNNSNNLILTNHITAYYLNQMKNEENKVQTKWILSKFKRYINQFDLLWFQTVDLNFLTYDRRSALKMNNYIQKLQNSQIFDEIQQKWLSNEKFFTSILVEFNDESDNIPIRLKRMNGPLLFMIVGGFAAILTHISEFIYLSFFKKG